MSVESAFTYSSHTWLHVLSRSSMGNHLGIARLGWATGWGVVRLVREKLEFVAFLDTRGHAEAAAAQAGIGCQACWLSYKDGLGFSLGAKDSDE